MAFDPTRPSSERNRARPVTAAEAFVQAEAKSRIQLSKRAGRLGLFLALVGVIGVFRRGRFEFPDLTVTFPGLHPIPFTIFQFGALFLIPLGLVIVVTGFALHRKYMRAAMSDPVTAGIFDPSVEWPEER